MATTVGSYAIAALTSPVNGTTPIDANTVRSNDNTIRTSHNDHDADPGIHVQSSALLARPLAGTVGRKWVTEDSGVYALWFDTGAAWVPVASDNVALRVFATEALAKGDIVKVTAWNPANSVVEVAKISAGTDMVFAVIAQTATINTVTYAVSNGLLNGLATNTFAVGDLLYSTVAGAFTTTKPTVGQYQPVALVLRSDATNGVVSALITPRRIVESSANVASTLVQRDAAGAIAATSLAGALTTAAQAAVTSVGTLTGLAVNGAIVVGTDPGGVDVLRIGGGIRVGSLRVAANLFEETATNALSTIGFNFTGFNGGTTQFRNVDIYDGKSAIVASFTGLNKALAMAGPFGMNGKTPVANVAAPAVATDLATALALVNDMRTRLINLGVYT